MQVEPAQHGLEALGGSVYKPYACPDCDRRYTRLSYVQRHQRLAHLGERNYVCSKCSSAFSRSDVLSRHITTCGNNKSRKRKAKADDDEESPPFATAGTAPIVTKSSFANSSASSSDNSPIFERRPSNGSPHSDLAASPDSLPLFGDFKAGASTDPMLGFSAVTTVGALSLPVATASTPAFDPFAPLLSSSGFNFPLDQPLTPSSMLTADINASFLDLLAASSVHVPSPLTFRNPDYQFLPSDFLSQPIQAEVDPRFKLGPERRQWMVEIQREKGMKWPVADDVEKLVAIAASTFVSFSPIAHLPTFDLNSEDIIIGFALATAGASKQSSGHAVVVDSDALLEHALLNKREFYQREFSRRAPYAGPQDSARGPGEPEPACTEDQRLANIIRAFLVYQTIGFSHVDKLQRRISANYHGALVTMIRSYGLIKKANEQSQRLATSSLPGRPLETMDPKTLDTHWRAVMAAETLTRSAWMIFLLDIACAVTNRQPSNVTLAEFGVLRLPCGEALWTANSASEWALMDAVGGFQLPTLSSALRSALGVPTSPPLPPLGAFAGAILRRTLHFLTSRLANAPPALFDEEIDQAVNILWAELGMAHPPVSRQAALARMQTAQQLVDRSCPIFDMNGNAPGSCSLTCLDEDGL